MIPIELQGAWLGNAGAELLFDVARAELAARLDCRIVVDPRWLRFEPPPDPTVGVLFPTRRLRAIGRRSERAMNALSRGRLERLVRAHGVVPQGDIRALVDISGFALSDQWGRAKARDRVSRAVEVSQYGAVVFLPQAFGPFESLGLRSEISRLFDHADLIYARERSSLEHLSSIVPDGAAIRMAPDITFGRRASAPIHVADVLVVPNERMLKQGGWAVHDYLDTCLAAVDAAIDLDRTVAVLIHSNDAGDIALADNLAAARSIDVVGVGMPSVQRKAVLAGSSLVVGSRFHALLGALASGVPAIALSWSHKYAQLFADTDMGTEHVFELPEPEGVARSVRVLLADDAEVGHRLRRRTEELIRQLDVMWEEVADTIIRRAAGVR